MRRVATTVDPTASSLQFRDWHFRLNKRSIGSAGPLISEQLRELMARNTHVERGVVSGVGDGGVGGLPDAGLSKDAVV